MSNYAIAIVRRIGTVERVALYRGWSPAREKAIRKLWRIFSVEVAR